MKPLSISCWPPRSTLPRKHVGLTERPFPVLARTLNIGQKGGSFAFLTSNVSGLAGLGELLAASQVRSAQAVRVQENR